MVNVMVINISALKHLHSIENQILIKIKLKRDTRLKKKKSSRARFLATLVKIPAFFKFFGLKRVKCFTQYGVKNGIFSQVHQATKG